MRSEDEIAKAHDLLVAVVLSEVPINLTDEQQKIIVATLDVLCWVLHHDHNTNFADNLARIENSLRQRGIYPVRVGSTNDGSNN